MEKSPPKPQVGQLWEKGIVTRLVLRNLAGGDELRAFVYKIPDDLLVHGDSISCAELIRGGWKFMGEASEIE